MGIPVKKYQPPPRTAMEVFNLLPEGTLAEVINNSIYMSPSPSFDHQRMIGKIFRMLEDFVEKNRLGVSVQDIDVYFDEENILRPDLVFVSVNNYDIITDNKVKGIPDIIIEIISPGNEKHDLEKKKAIYEKFGVKEYFIINPSNSETITWYFSGKKFIKQPKQKGKVKSKILKKTFSF